MFFIEIKKYRPANQLFNDRPGPGLELARNNLAARQSRPARKYKSQLKKPELKAETGVLIVS